MIINEILTSQIHKKTECQNKNTGDFNYLVPSKNLESISFCFENIDNTSIANSLSDNYFLQVYENSHQNVEKIADIIISKSLKSVEAYKATIKIRFIRCDKKHRLYFQGIYLGSLARFFPKQIQEDEVYITNTGNREIDRFQEKYIKNYNSINIEDLDKTKKKGVIFGSYPRDSIKNSQYRDFYEKHLTNGRDQIKNIQVNELSGTTVLDRLEESSIILRPKTWIISTNDMTETILNKKWRIKNKVPKQIQINLYGGTICINTTDSTVLLINIKKILLLTKKKVKYLFFEESVYNDYDQITDIYLGYTK